MVKTLGRFTVLATVLALLSGCGDSPVEVSLEPPTMGGGARVVISASADVVELQGFSINRGNCRGSFFEKGRRLKFGQTSKIFSGCRLDDIKEVEIKTDQGEYTFTF